LTIEVAQHVCERLLVDLTFVGGARTDNAVAGFDGLCKALGMPKIGVMRPNAACVEPLPGFFRSRDSRDLMIRPQKGLRDRRTDIAGSSRKKDPHALILKPLVSRKFDGQGHNEIACTARPSSITSRIRAMSATWSLRL